MKFINLVGACSYSTKNFASISEHSLQVVRVGGGLGCILVVVSMVSNDDVVVSMVISDDVVVPMVVNDDVLREAIVHQMVYDWNLLVMVMYPLNR